MAIEVFNRYEKKYMLDTAAFEGLQTKLLDHMRPDAYQGERGCYTITNLYYDTPDSHLIRTSLGKPSYKEKLRLRAYGVPDLDARVYVEIKKKVSGLVNKRRGGLTLKEAYEFLASGAPPEEAPGQNRQVLSEIGYLLQIHALRPALYLAYDRRAYFGIEQPDLRVSFDRNIRARRHDLRLEAGDYGSPLLDGDCRLMEIKVSRSIPLWLCRLLSEYQIYPISFSKYGTEYQRALEGARDLIPGYSPPSQREERPHWAAAHA